MKAASRSVKFILATAIVFIFIFLFFTTRGIDILYGGVLSLFSKEVSEIETIPDDDDIELIGDAKILVVALSGDNEIDVKYTPTMLKYLLEKSENICIALEISTCEAGLLNAYLKTGELEYYNEAALFTQNEVIKTPEFREFLTLLIDKNIFAPVNEHYYFAGLAPESSEKTQRAYLDYLIKCAAGNPMNDEIRDTLDIEGKDIITAASAILEGTKKNLGMYKQHFLTDYVKLRYALEQICAESTLSSDEIFALLYKEKMSERYIILADGQTLYEEKLIDKIHNALPFFEHRTYIFDVFRIGDGAGDIRITNSENMKYADSYARFVYSLADKEFTSAPDKSSKYYIRIE